MYTKIYKRLNFYKKLLIFFKIFIILFIFFILFLIFYSFFLKNNTFNIKTEYIVSNIMEKPVLQITDNNDLINIISKNAKITENAIIINDVKIDSKNLKGYSKQVIVDNKTDDIILKYRPNIIFYNN